MRTAVPRDISSETYDLNPNAPSPLVFLEPLARGRGLFDCGSRNRVPSRYAGGCTGQLPETRA